MWELRDQHEDQEVPLKPFLEALLVKEYVGHPSNWRSRKNL